jgi:hypothetical protein
LREQSPVGSGGDKHPGLYRDSHTVFIDGHVVKDAGVWRPGQQVNIANPVSYSRKIEAGRIKLSVPAHVYEDAALSSLAATATASRSNLCSCRFGSATSPRLLLSRRSSRLGAGA